MLNPGPAELPAAFAAAMDRLGPFEDRSALAVAVSGGADSMALALLARDWVRQQSGTLHALVVDHSLRPESGAEAAATIGRLAAMEIKPRLLVVTDLPRGPALAERARIARYKALTEACRTLGILHLLLGHHAADQAETLMMRVLRKSGPHGLAGMPALTETRDTRLLRPLLEIPPAALRQYLQVRSVAWVEDPSNIDMKALRPRLRVRQSGDGEVALTEAARTAGVARRQSEAATAMELATYVMIYPEGFARLTDRRLSPGALASLIRTIAGAAYPPSIGQIAALAAAPQPATVAGIRLVAAGVGLLLVREEAAMQGPIQAAPDARWDRRMRLAGPTRLPGDAMIAALGDEATVFRKRSPLPSAVLRTLPALRRGKVLLAVPHLGYVSDDRAIDTAFRFDPPRPAAGAIFHPI